MKRRYADKWSTDVLEQVAACCNVASRAKSASDWELFLNAIYETAVGLPTTQRAILLLSQEHALSYADIGRVLNLPHSTVMHNLARAVDRIVAVLKERSLIDITVRNESKVAETMYCEHYVPEAKNEKTRFGFYYHHDQPWYFHGPNLLADDPNGGS